MCFLGSCTFALPPLQQRRCMTACTQAPFGLTNEGHRVAEYDALDYY